MYAKEKNNTKKMLLVIIPLIVFLCIYLYISNKYEKKSYAYNQEENKNTEINQTTKISNAKEINLDEIINKNTENIGYREEISIEEVELEYITKYRKNNELYKGTKKVSQEGRNGIQKITTKITYDENGKKIKEQQMSAVVTKSSINKVIDIGTKKREEKSTTKQSAITNLDFNMALNKPSGLTLEQFKKVLTDSKDKNKIFQENAEYFYYIEEQYNINGIFVAAVGIHESAWGTSKIARNKHNLFGYGAYDSNPYNGAYIFENYSECIDLIARVFVKYYINPKGTSIYDGQKANGKYYNGNTLVAVNKKYATDKNWANAVYKYMKYLYEKK